MFCMTVAAPSPGDDAVLDQCIARATHLKVAVDKDPLTTVLRGTAQAMLYREDYEGIFIN